MKIRMLQFGKPAHETLTTTKVPERISLNVMWYRYFCNDDEMWMVNANADADADANPNSSCGSRFLGAENWIVECKTKVNNWNLSTFY